MAAKDCSCTRAIGNEYCVFHPEEKLIFECTNCPRELACISCATSIHQSHTFVDIKQSVPENLQKINSFIQHSKEKLLSDVGHDINRTVSKLQEIEQMCKNEIKEVQKQEVRLKELVAVSTTTEISRLELLLKDTTHILNRHKVHLEKLQDDLATNNQAYTQNVEVVTDLKLYDTRTEIEKQSDHEGTPEVPEVTISTFIPCNDPQPLIEKAFGEQLKEDASKDTSTEKSTSEYKQKSPVTPKYTFLREHKTLYESSNSFNVFPNGICRAPSSHAWLLESNECINNRNMRCFDSKGNETRTLETDVRLRSICTDPTTGDIYGTVYSTIFYRDNSIRRINTESGKTSIMFRTDTKPHSIGCTNDKHLVLSMGNTVKKCRFNGQLVHSYKFTGLKLPELSVCSTSNYIALIHGSCIVPSVVIVLDQSLKKIYEYSGQGLQHIFRPRTASFDGKYLLVGEDDNIIVLDGGKLVHTVHTKEKSNVTAICVQKHGVLLVGCLNKILSIIYME